MDAAGMRDKPDNSRCSGGVTMTTPEITSALRNRSSSRAFDPRPVEPEKIAALIEAFRWAPSSQNKQSWRLIIARAEPARAAWDAALDPGNQSWAPRAPVKLVVLANSEEQPDHHGQQRCLIDGGLALHALLVQACAMGLNVRAMAGWNQEKVRAAFDIPDACLVVALVAAGYPGSVDALPADVQLKEARPRVRRDPEEIVFHDRFGVSSAEA